MNVTFSAKRLKSEVKIEVVALSGATLQSIRLKSATHVFGRDLLEIIEQEQEAPQCAEGKLFVGSRSHRS